MEGGHGSLRDKGTLPQRVRVFLLTAGPKAVLWPSLESVSRHSRDLVKVTLQRASMQSGLCRGLVQAGFSYPVLPQSSSRPL